jgi:membrane-associated phospholipid phosphatase
LGFLLALASALSSHRAHAQLPPPEEPVDDTPEEQGPAPQKPPEQEPLVVRPKPAKQPRAVNTLPLVSKDAPPPLIWKWPTFSTADFVVTLTGGAVTLGAAIIKPRSRHELTGPIGFDKGVRNALRAGTLSNRYLFRDASDVGLSLTVSWPFVADALTTAWWYRGSRETAQEMALIDLETLAISGAVQGVTNVLVSRERPFGRDCGQGELPGDAIDCTGSFHYRSFFSGHSAFSFTGAALICIHHVENELLGPPWDALSCAGGYAVAATTATFRVVADVHYASDVLLGAAVGTLVGYSVPLLHYRKLGGASRAAVHAAATRPLQLHLVPSPGGVGLMGIF